MKSLEVKTEASDESYYMLEDISKEGLKTYLRQTMKIFNERYDVESEKIDDKVELISPSF